MRRLIRWLAVLVLLAIVAALLLVVFADHAAKVAIEQGGTYALGTPTALDRASIGVTTGRFGLDGLTVRNPEGFKDPNFFFLKSGELDLSMKTLLSDKIEADKLELDGLDVVLARNSDGKTNYDAILANLKKLQGPEDPKGGAKPKPSETPSKPGKQFLIHEVVISNISAHVDVPALGRTNVTVPMVRLSNVGSDQSMSELIATITNAVLQAIVSSAGNILPADFLKDLSSKLPNLSGVSIKVSEGVKSALESLGKGAGDLGKKAGDALKDVGKGLDDLIKKK